MTREEAVEYLELLQVVDAPKLREAIKMAIDALEQPDTDLSEYSDKLWRNAYERGKREALSDRSEI